VVKTARCAPFEIRKMRSASGAPLTGNWRRSAARYGGVVSRPSTTMLDVGSMARESAREDH
jgi:hypothetical protein